MDGMDSLMHQPYWPVIVLASSMILVMGLIGYLRFHPLIALILASVYVGVLSPELPVLEGQALYVAALELPWKWEG